VEELINKILEWPLIVQGALGSALFWAILSFGQIATAKLINIVSAYSKKTRKRFLQNQITKYYGYSAHRKGDQTLSASVQVSLIYGANRDFFRGMIWVVLGLLLTGVIDVLGSVGFLGGLFYFFKALNRVQSIRATDDVDGKLKELRAQLKELESEK
jgi:hypothetical protein